MTTVLKIARHEMNDVLRSRWLAGYGLFFLAAAEGLLRFSGNGDKALVSLVSVVLFVIPLVSVVFATVYLYNAREFIELLLAQPIRRRQLFAGLFLGLLGPLALAFVVGTALPFVVRGVSAPGERITLAVLLATGAALTTTFTALAFVIAVRTEDRLRALGSAIGLWLALSLVYDGVVLLLAAVYTDYPLERAMLGLTMANPIDLARVILLLRLDVGALMGYTGAVFERFFGGAAGLVAASLALAAWVAAPIALGARAFQRKDF